MKIRWNKFCILFFILFQVQAKAQDKIKGDSVLNFMKFLESNHEYSLAGKALIDAYQKDSTGLSKIYFSKLYDYKMYQSIISQTEKLNSLPYLSNEHFKFYQKSKLNLIEKTDLSYYKSDSLVYSIYVLGQNLMHKTYDSLPAIILTKENCKVCKELISLSHEGKKLPYKSKFWATSLSVLFPGLGKIYLKQTKDGFVSAFLVSTMLGQSVYGFHRYGYKSVFGWINGLFGTGFYLANIYGTYKQSDKYNHNLDLEYQRKVEEVLLSY